MYTCVQADDGFAHALSRSLQYVSDGVYQLPQYLLFVGKINSLDGPPHMTPLARAQLAAVDHGDNAACVFAIVYKPWRRQGMPAIEVR